MEDIISKQVYDNITDSIFSAALENRFDYLLYDINDKIVPGLRDFRKRLLNNSDLITRLRNDHFDLAFFESVWYEFSYICNVIKVPYVVMDPIITNPYILWLMRADRNPAYYPGNFADFDQHMTFTERLQSSLTNIDGFVKNGIFQWFMDPSPDWSSYIPLDKSSSQSLMDAQLWFIRTHFALDYPRPLPPHVIPMGGLMSRPSQPLPEVYFVVLVK